MEKSIGVIRKDGPSSKPYCIHFSNDKRECFASRKQAVMREKQINYFKNKKASNSLSGDDLYAMAHLDIHAVHKHDDSLEVVFITAEEDGYLSFLIRSSQDNEEDQVFILNEDFPEYDKYKNIIYNSVIKLSEAADNNIILLSNAVIGDQLIDNSHTHTIDLSNVDTSAYVSLRSSVDAGHSHYCDISPDGQSYIGSAAMDIGGVKISHYHLIVVKLGSQELTS